MYLFAACWCKRQAGPHCRPPPPRPPPPGRIHLADSSTRNEVGKHNQKDKYKDNDNDNDKKTKIKHLADRSIRSEVDSHPPPPPPPPHSQAPPYNIGRFFFCKGGNRGKKLNMSKLHLAPQLSIHPHILHALAHCLALPFPQQQAHHGHGCPQLKHYSCSYISPLPQSESCHGPELEKNVDLKVV